MKAVLMAGGEGTRLRPLTSNQPKPLVSICNQPVMTYIINLLKKYKINDVVATLQFLPQLIKNYYGDGSDLGINLSYAIEDEPLGTAGSVKNAQSFIDETFLVISGDAICDYNLKKAIDFHKRKKSLATLVLARVESPLEFGVVITDKSGRITRFLEKPTWAQVFSDTVNTGLYILEPEVLSHIPDGANMDFSKDLFPKLLAEGAPLYGYVADGYWCDIGNFEQYRQVHEDILANNTNVPVNGIKMGQKVWIGEDATIHPSVMFKGSAFIGNHCKIEEGAVIGDGTTIGNNVVVSAGTKTSHAIVQENAYIGQNVVLDSCIIGKNCDVKRGVNVQQNVIIGDDCLIGANAIIKPNVKIYPFKSVDGGATVSRSIIWETRGMRSLFGVNGISGISNVDITPELATRVAMAYGTSLPKESFVVTSRDTNRVSRLVKRAMTAGLTATGIHVRDLRVAPTPVNRFNVGTTRCAGGIHIQVSPFEPQAIQINIFDKNGINLDENGQRDIEKYFAREDFRRAFHNEVGEIIFPPRTSEFYSAGLIRRIDTERIKRSKFKIIVDYAFGTASFSMPLVLGKMGCDVISLNAFTDETKTTLMTADFDNLVDQLSNTVKMFKANFGLLIDGACEKLHVIDEKGNLIHPNDLLLLMVYLVSNYEKQKGRIAVPLSVTHQVEKIAKKNGRKVIRTKVSAASLMETSLKKDVVFGGAQGGGFIFPRFLPAYDAVMSFGKLLEYLSYEDKPLSKIVASLPKCCMEREQTFCSWDHKGLVMRKLIEEAKDSKVELIDGIKIYEDDSSWALILAHPEDPVIDIVAEAATRKKAKDLVAKYVKLVNEITNRGIND